MDENKLKQLSKTIIETNSVFRIIIDESGTINNYKLLTRSGVTLINSSDIVLFNKRLMGFLSD